MAMEDQEPEASSFESGDTLAAFVASTPLLSDAWLICSGANASVPGGFTVEHVGNVGYIAFSGIQAMPVAAGSEVDGGMVALDGDGLFRGLRCRREGEEEEEEEPVMVHGGMLRLFESIHGHPYFQEQVTELLKQKKPIIITGHSIGASIASLTALWLLCYLKSIFSSLSVLCITFGAPLLGNDSFSKAILKERWAGKFCHVVSSYDLMPRLFFAPLASVAAPLSFLLRYWNLSMENEPALQMSEAERNGLLGFVASHLEIAAKTEDDDDYEDERPRRSLWPFGSYLLCSKEGGICVDNAVCAIEMMRLMMLLGSLEDCINDHLNYGDYVAKISYQFLTRRQFTGFEIPESSYEASVSMALQSSGTYHQESISQLAEDCLKTARRVGMAQNMNSANLAIRLSLIVPFRVEIEWYKSCCDESPDQLGYYDSFKSNVSRMVTRINMNRIKLGNFWDKVIEMLVNGELPYDFDARRKWVNAAHIYMLLVEPLDIAEYYKPGEHRLKGHYLTDGRARRFEIFDRWWKERGSKDTRRRSKFATLTQDSCFWAKVEEAKDCLDRIKSEADYGQKRVLLDAIGKFEMYASGLVENKEVSCDVLARNSTYSVWAREWQALKTQLPQPFI